MNGDRSVSLFNVHLGHKISCLEKINGRVYGLIVLLITMHSEIIHTATIMWHATVVNKSVAAIKLWYKANGAYYNRWQVYCDIVAGCNFLICDGGSNVTIG